MSLEIVRRRGDLQKIVDGWKAQNLKIGFVPTMGALHDGHLSLVKIALQHADRCVVSIFVNPTQFAPYEDFAAYPRNEIMDAEKLQSAGAHVAYFPSQEDIYPVVAISDKHAGPAAEGLEGALRPGHFDGVATVVERLFKHVKPDVAVFGEKDYQQLLVVEEMVHDRHLPVRIIPAPTMRDEHGLALSSRNAYLSTDELKVARKLNKILFEVVRGEISTDEAKQKILAAGFDEVQYVEKRWGRVLAAAKLGRTRLIDNVKT